MKNKKIIHRTRLIIQRDYIIEEEIKLLNLIAKEKFNIDFVIDENNYWLIEKLLQYFNGHPDFEKGGNDFHKGIMIFGPIGTGKSILMKIFKEYCFKTSSKHQFLIENSNTVVKKYKKNAIDGITKYTEKTKIKFEQDLRPIVLMINDLGAEKTMEASFGPSEDVIANLLDERYEIFQDLPGIVTHVTTNLNNEGLQKRYGNRIHSRIVAMFNPFALLGEDRRK